MKHLLLSLAALLLAACSAMPQPPKVDFYEPSNPKIEPPPRAHGPSSGSLFSVASYRPAFEDRRARLVGDTVTIQIVESLSASQKSNSSVDREAATKAGVTAFPFLSAATTGKFAIDASSSNTFSGKGGTDTANTFTGSITATVVDVLPNGNLVVTGDKQIGVNQNVDVMRFSGTIDPRAIQPGNTIASTQVANVRVEQRGRGAQNEAQTMGWLSRFFLTIAPF